MKESAGRLTGGTGTNDNDVIWTIPLVTNPDAFMLFSTNGAMDVFVSFDGTNYSTAPLSLEDLGATSTDPVIVTAAGRLYGFRLVGAVKLKVQQNGATAVQNACITYGVM